MHRLLPIDIQRSHCSLDCLCCCSKCSLVHCINLQRSSGLGTLPTGCSSPAPSERASGLCSTFRSGVTSHCCSSELECSSDESEQKNEVFSAAPRPLSVAFGSAVATVEAAATSLRHQRNVSSCREQSQVAYLGAVRSAESCAMRSCRIFAYSGDAMPPSANSWLPRLLNSSSVCV